ncbi:cysteine hydrolase family protein [Pseudonocardia benzenivorans]
MELDPRRTAFIAVHYQNDVITPEGAFGPSFAEQATAAGIVPTTKTLHAAARAAGAQVVYTRVAFQPGYGDLVGNFPLLAMVGQQGCLVDGTSAAAIVDELTPLDGDTVVTHQRVSGFVGSELDAVLRGRGVDTVVITGVATNMSVESTARSAGTSATARSSSPTRAARTRQRSTRRHWTACACSARLPPAPMFWRR